ncbi:hypothetical protein H2199_006491 [Coniosporium tulheliwenetii]|uniref:Uncharacterized protein n=1 Tax=Coniosporium tulheliwenetii TaxID=3383036 RepID=A0ACC2YVQ7_9PEZI|nr:hypothetical protein H2199_006491 [Cladosporium sp. JES 115]
MKLRLERAMLLEQLEKRMEANVDESDRSTSPPPTPQDKPLRSKRAHRKTTPPLPDTGTAAETSHPSPQGPPQHQRPHMTLLDPYSSTQSTPDPSRHTNTLFFSTLNGTPDTNQIPPLSLHQAHRQTSHGLPSIQHYDRISYEDRHGENGTPVEYAPHGRSRAYSGANGSAGRGITGEMVGVGPEVRVDANGERRVQPEVEMAEASPSQGGFGGLGVGLGL